MAPRLAGSRVDDYELIEHLADGAQAEVHRARDMRTGRDVVLKFPHRHTLDQPVLASRWRRETALLADLAHPNIQCALNVGEHRSEPYLVLEYAGGGTIDRWASTQERLPVAQVLDWSQQLAAALAYLHQRGVVHKDVKPGNLLLTDELTLKLADFGSASRARAPRRHWWQLPVPPEGTPEYMSPEQVLGEPADARVDVYAWGVVTFELVTGQVPFTGPDPLSAMTAHLRDDPPRISDLRPEVPAALGAVVMKSLRRDRAARYPDAGALRADLGRLDQLDPLGFDLGPEPPMSGSPGATEARAFAKLALFIATGFVGLATLAIGLTALLR